METMATLRDQISLCVRLCAQACIHMYMDTYGNVNIQYAFTDLTVLEVPVFKNVLTNIETLMLFLML